MPWLGASDSRTLRGTVVSNTLSPKYFATSARTWFARFMRPSNIVNSTPSIVELRVVRRLDLLDRRGQRRQALEREVLGLHRHDDAIGGDQRVERQQAERRRAVDDDVVVVADDRRERVGEEPLATVRADQLDLRADEVGRRRRDEQRRDLGRPDDVGERDVADERVVDRQLDLVARVADADDALPCGSKSTSSTRYPRDATDAARLIAVVVLPTPPFWFATATIRDMAAR